MNKIYSFLRYNSAANVVSRECIRKLCIHLPKPNQETALITFNKDLVIEDYEQDISELKKENEESIFIPPKEDLSHVAPYFKPTFNFAAYVNKSETLQNFVKLGVDLHKIERKKFAPEFILKLDFENDVKKYLILLNDLKVENLGQFITVNPFIFKENLDDLTVRLNYLQSKSFSKEMISTIVNKNPFWLNFSTKRIDNRLGHFQKTFKLTGFEIRLLATKQPKLITYNMHHIKLNTFSVKEEMGFDDEQTKKLLLSTPKVWMMSQDSIIQKFDYLHNTMNISHDQILLIPNIFTCRKSRLKSRHQFLLKLGRAQYNPKEENYVSLLRLMEGSDSEFCTNVAKSTVDIYNTFMKSL